MNEEQATALVTLLNRLGLDCQKIAEHDYEGDEPGWYVTIGVQDRKDFKTFRRHLRWVFDFPADEVTNLALSANLAYKWVKQYLDREAELAR